MSGDAADKIKVAVSGVLTSGEQIVAVATQIVINSPFRKDSAVVTNRRFIIFRPKILGRMDLEDFLWQDVTDIRLSTKLLGAEITVTAKRRDADGSLRTKTGTVDGLDKPAALRLYAEAQRFEEEWREKNRVRQMEEERARAGGVYLQGAGAHNLSSGMSGSSSPDSIEQRLAKLKELHQKGLITDAEFESRKAQIISEL
jgi:hypothetical protein